tara:strand:- start:286 stop:672 length:387 start_codon:yes stop_codon:yes gene_type:complete
MDLKQKYIMGRSKSELTKENNKKELVLKIYSEDHNLPIGSIAYRSGTSIERAEKYIKEYQIGLVAYFNFGIAPSMSQENTFFLFSDNGAEKKLLKEGDKLWSSNFITPLEALFIKINLGYEIKLNNHE